MKRTKRHAGWPTWWDWDLELTPHLERRMEDRQFTEVDLRKMLEEASALEPGMVEGRYEVATKHSGGRWKVIIEPDYEARMIVVVTAYPSD